MLGSRSHITFLIVNHNHVKTDYAGVLYTLASVRERFWVLRDVSCVCNAIKECRDCHTAFHRPGSQVMSSLPRYRIKPGRPAFMCVVVDFSGIFITKNGKKTYQVLPLCFHVYGCSWGTFGSCIWFRY